MSTFDELVKRRGTDCYKWDFQPGNHHIDDLLPMWVADMDFPSPPEILNAIRRRTEHPVFGYTFAGESYKESFTAWQRTRNGWDVEIEDLLFASGVMPAVRAAILEFAEPGEEVIIQTPVYFPFSGAIKDNGRTVVENPLREVDGRYEMDLAHLRSAITDRTRMILLCSPHNPVGRVWTHDELAGLVQIAAEHSLLIVSDEIHADIVRSTTSFVPILTIPGAAERAIALHAPSKTFNLAGLASGTAVAPDSELRSRLERAIYRLGMNLPNLLSLEAAHAAYRECAPWVDQLLIYLDAQIEWCKEEVRARFGDAVRVPAIEGTYLAWLDLRDLLASAAVSHKEMQRILLHEARLFLSEGMQFGSAGEGFFRMNLATPRANVADGLDRLERAVRIAKDRG